MAARAEDRGVVAKPRRALRQSGRLNASRAIELARALEVLGSESVARIHAGFALAEIVGEIEAATRVAELTTPQRPCGGLVSH